MCCTRGGSQGLYASELQIRLALKPRGHVTRDQKASVPKLGHVQAKIRKLESIEKYIAIKNNKLTIHSKKWEAKDGNEISYDQAYVLQYVDQMNCK